jgi:pimeloyl-ACP methyl ester carboxylesterase
MGPFKPHNIDSVSSTLPEAEISKVAVVELGGRIRAVLKSRSTATLIRLALVALFVGLGVSSLLGSQSADASVAGESSAATAPPASIGWRSCGDQLDCARVPVPLDWNNPNGPQISLLVIRHRASKPNQRIGSLFLNFGGPGVPGVPDVRRGGNGLDLLFGGRFDVVSWDPRGTGESTHVSCFKDVHALDQFWGQDWTIPYTVAESGMYVPKTIEYAQRCAALSGSLLEHISTTDTVRDLDYLRQLVGDAQLTYRGLSYGTFLGQIYINLFPTHVRAVVLDANIDPVAFSTSVEDAIATSSTDTNLVFEKFLDLCERAGPAKCALAGQGGAAQRVQALLNTLRQGPIPASGAPAPKVLRYGDAQIEIWSLLGQPAKWPQLADELNQAANKDGTAMATQVRNGRIGLLSIFVSATALQCADKPQPPPGLVLTWPKVMQHLTSTDFVGLFEGWGLWAPCASWQSPSANRYTGPWNATTANPILVVGNKYDPRTRYANSVLAARTLGNAVLLTLEGYGHVSDADPSVCIDTAVKNYLITPTAPLAGNTCQPDHVPFDPNFDKVASSEEQLFE